MAVSAANNHGNHLLNKKDKKFHSMNIISPLCPVSPEHWILCLNPYPCPEIIFKTGDKLQDRNCVLVFCAYLCLVGVRGDRFPTML